MNYRCTSHAIDLGRTPPPTAAVEQHKQQQQQQLKQQQEQQQQHPKQQNNNNKQTEVCEGFCYAIACLVERPNFPSLRCFLVDITRYFLPVLPSNPSQCPVSVTCPFMEYSVLFSPLSTDAMIPFYFVYFLSKSAFFVPVILWFTFTFCFSF